MVGGTNTATDSVITRTTMMMMALKVGDMVRDGGAVPIGYLWIALQSDRCHGPGTDLFPPLEFLLVFKRGALVFLPLSHCYGIALPAVLLSAFSSHPRPDWPLDKPPLFFFFKAGGIRGAERESASAARSAQVPTACPAVPTCRHFSSKQKEKKYVERLAHGPRCLKMILQLLFMISRSLIVLRGQ